LQALVAFTIEFDNAAELQIQHRTSRHKPADPGLWLTSMAMWLNCMRDVGADPIALGEVRRRARTDTNLDGMRRWGYLTVEPGPGDPKYRAKNSQLVLRATERGMQASEIWRPLTGTVEQAEYERSGEPATRTPPRCRCRGCSRASCSLSRSPTSVSRGDLSRSRPTCCAFSTRTACRSATCPS
jgi:hypothetical protein